MKITKIETPRYYGHVSGHVIVKVHVDDGPVQLITKLTSFPNRDRLI